MSYCSIKGYQVIPHPLLLHHPLIRFATAHKHFPPPLFSQDACLSHCSYSFPDSVLFINLLHTRNLEAIISCSIHTHTFIYPYHYHAHFFSLHRALPSASEYRSSQRGLTRKKDCNTQNWSYISTDRHLFKSNSYHLRLWRFQRQIRCWNRKLEWNTLRMFKDLI